MTFDPTKPEADDILADSQADLLTNYGQQDVVFGVDHVAFSATEDRGKHNKATLHFDDAVQSPPMPSMTEITEYPHLNDNNRINGNVIYGSTQEIVNHVPFAIAYIELLAANAISAFGNSVNFDIGNSSHTNNTVSMVFNVSPDNANYQVFVTPGTNAGYANLGTVRVANQTVNGFDILGQNFSVGTIEFYIFVYEV